MGDVGHWGGHWDIRSMQLKLSGGERGDMPVLYVYRAAAYRMPAVGIRPYILYTPYIRIPYAVYTPTHPRDKGTGIRPCPHF